MSDNPYQPSQVSNQPDGPVTPGAKDMVFGPSLAIMIVAGISTLVFTIAFVAQCIVMISGVEVPQRPNMAISPEVSTQIKVGVALLLTFIHAIVTWGGYCMMKLQKFALVRIACLVCVIPCFSPCYFLGIPFGIWALVVIGKPGVRQSFKS